MRTIIKKLNMTPGGIPLLIRLNQYDSDFSIVFTLYSSDQSWTLESGTTAKIRGTKKSGTGYSADATVNVSNSTVTIAGDQQMTAVAGLNTYEVVLYDGELELSSANFFLYCEQAAMSTDTITDDTVLAEITDFNTQIAAATAAANRAEAAADSVTIDPTLSQSGQAADAKATGDAFTCIADYEGDTTGENYSPWQSGHTLNTEGKIGSSGYYSACPTFIHVPEFVDTIRVTTGANYGAIVCTYSGANENSFIERFTYTTNHGYDLDVSVNKYIRIAIGSTDVANVGTVSFKYRYPLKDTIDNISALLGTTSSSLLKAITTDYSTVAGIQQNTDYDTLTSPGNFYVGSSASAQTMSHCPVKVAHRLIVFTTTSANRLWQIVIPNANTDIYMRTNMGSWNEWNKIITSRNGIESYDVRVTSDNYQTVLPDLDEAQVNIVYSIAPNTPIPNIPEGNYNVAGADQSYGVASGTLITLRGAKMGSGYEKFQLFMSAAGLPEGGTGSIINFRGCRYSGGTLVWDKWSKMGNGVNLRATNTFIQESRIQAGTAMFSDMNDAPNNTIVQIDLDAVSMLNNPFQGHSCVLITLCPSYVSRHGMLQLCSGIEGGVAHLFFRYGWQNNPGEIRWSPWMECTATQAVIDTNGS